MPEHLNERVFVIVEGGCVSDIVNAKGESIAYGAIIDYDLDQCGAYPVCHEERTPDEDCPTCGYNESKDNALSCAVAYHETDDQAMQSESTL